MNKEFFKYSVSLQFLIWATICIIFIRKRLILLNCSAVCYARSIWVLSFLTLKKIDYWFLINRCLKNTAIMYIMYRKGFGIAIHYPGAAGIGHFVDSSYNLLRLFCLSLIYNWWIKNWICYNLYHHMQAGKWPVLINQVIICWCSTGVHSGTFALHID